MSAEIRGEEKKIETKGGAITPVRGEAGAAGRVCALAGTALPRHVPQVAVGVVEASNLALKFSGVMGLWGRSCLRWRAREPRELPPSSLSPFSHAPV